MKYQFLFFFLTLNTLLFSQKNNLEGRWIIDKTTYATGKPLEINHFDFSKYGEYNFLNNIIFISGLNMNTDEYGSTKVEDINQIPFTIHSNTLAMKNSKIDFEFEGDYLLLKVQGDDKVTYLLSPESFLKKYPEFQAKKIERNGNIVYEENVIERPEFIYKGGFIGFLATIYHTDDSYPKSENYSKFQFVLSKDNKISDIKILNSITPKFDAQLIESLQKKENSFRNKTGKNLLLTRGFRINVRNEFKHISKEDRVILKIAEKGNAYFIENDFENAIKTYDKVKDLKSSAEESYKVSEIYLKMGISYLAINNKIEACRNFNKAGDHTDFSVRNYLINFCSEK